MHCLFMNVRMCVHCDVNPRNFNVISFLLCTERQNLSCLQILTLSILMGKMQRQEKARYFHLFIFHTCFWLIRVTE